VGGRCGILWWIKFSLLGAEAQSSLCALSQA
jgi:hypothetical protein